MLVSRFETEEEWLDARRGKITGTRLKDLIVKRGNGKKAGYYEIIAERLALPADGENAMDRGHRLEVEAINRFTEETGKKVNTDLVMWMRDDNNSIAISPDGFIGETAAVEVKCLNSASHVEALLTNKIPNGYWEQALQYFIVNDKLKTLYFVFYDPRLMCKEFFYFEINRSEVQEQVTEYIELERETLKEIDEIVLRLSDF